MAVTLDVVTGAVGTFAFFIWLEYTQRYDEKVSKIGRERRRRLREKLREIEGQTTPHAGELVTGIKESEEAKKKREAADQQAIDKKFETLLETEYPATKAAESLLSDTNNVLLISWILALLSIINDYAVSNFPTLQIPQLQGLFAVAAFIALILGVVDARNLRRMARNEPLIDPAPPIISFLLILLMAANSVTLNSLLSLYGHYNRIGWALFVTFILSYVGGIGGITGWDRGRKYRIGSILVLVSPYIVYFIALLLIAIGVSPY